MMKGIKVAVMGYGTVGSGVCEVLTEKPALLSKKSDAEFVTLKYVLDIKDLSGTPAAPYWVKSVDRIVEDPEIDVVVETMGGVKPAFEFCMKCLSAGKSVVTSNKQLVAEKGEALFAEARAKNVAFRFGAAVCGGIPVMKTMAYGLAANRIESFAGILNGTTNFILTKMFAEHASFDDALKEAQQRGYAEADPTADVEGADACRKTAILCSMAFGSHVYPEEIPTEGITRVSPADAILAADFGGSVKLIGWAKKENGAVFAGVCPMVVPYTGILSRVEGVYNAISINGDQIGSVLLYGKGAGKRATASAVAADILDCARKPGFDPAYSWAPKEKSVLSDGSDRPVRLYARGFAQEPEAAFARISGTLGVRRLRRENAPENELAFVTERLPEQTLKRTLSSVSGFELLNTIRVFEG